MLTVYFLETEYRYMGWNDVFLELVLHLRDKYKAKIIHKKGGSLYIDKFDYNLPDCEILIHDEEKDILRGISWSESRTHLYDRVFRGRNNPEDILMHTQHTHWFPPEFDRSPDLFKLKPTTFYTFTPTTSHEYFWHQRSFHRYDNLIDKIFCLFTTRREDPFTLREMGLLSESPGPLTIDDYLSLAIKHKIGLALSSTAEVCYREIEYMAVGLPMMRLEYRTQLDPPLIPNYHYIAISRDGFAPDPNSDRLGGPTYVEAYKNKFFEVKDDYKFLDFITHNAREYYTEYCSPQNRLKHVLNSLEL